MKGLRKMAMWFLASNLKSTATQERRTISEWIWEREVNFKMDYWNRMTVPNITGEEKILGRSSQKSLKFSNKLWQERIGSLHPVSNWIAMGP